MKTLGLAAIAAFALTATSASANGYWQNGSYYSYPAATSQAATTYVAPSYAAPTYVAPTTTVVGSVGPIQSTGTVTYAQPTYIAPATTTTYAAPATTTYTAPVTTYVAPTTTYTAPTTTYVAPSYTAPTTTTYVAPTTYTAPAPVAPRVTIQRVPRYDGRDRVRQRLANQRSRIERALSRGELRRGEEQRLRTSLREIRRTFRAYRDNDGYIGRHEEAQLMAMLNRNSQRIRRLANNGRVAGGTVYSPFVPFAPFGY